MVKCAICNAKATKKVIWADGRAYQPACVGHVEAVKKMLTKRNGKMTELAGVQDLSDTIDLVSSSAYPSLERKPGGPDNWVERAGGLPKYIERIAKHLHYEKGMTISHAIATAVNTVRRWARMGKVAKYGDPNNKRVSAKTAAQAAAAVTSWETKKKAGKVSLTDAELAVIDLCDVSEGFALDLLSEINTLDLSVYDDMGTGAELRGRATLLPMDINALAQRANQITDPEARAAARRKVLDLSLAQSAATIDLASTIAPRNARGRASDGRRSYKGQGKWKHGFIPANRAAHEAKAKGSPIAIKRTTRLYGKGSTPDDQRQATRESQAPTPKSRRKEGGGSQKGERSGQTVKVNDKGVKESASDIAHLRNAEFQDKGSHAQAQSTVRKEASKQSRTPARAKQKWEDIPESDKTVRNGTRYVVTTFGGKRVITEWTGGVREGETEPLNKRKVQTSITPGDATKMSTAQVRQLIKNPRTSASARKTLRAALRAKGTR